MPTCKVLEVPNGSGYNGTPITQNSLNGFQQQQWLFVPTGDGYYVIQNVLTGKVLDVAGADKGNGAPIQQWAYLKGSNQTMAAEAGGRGPLRDHQSQQRTGA